MIVTRVGLGSLRTLVALRAPVGACGRPHRPVITAGADPALHLARG